MQSLRKGKISFWREQVLMRHIRRVVNATATLVSDFLQLQALRLMGLLRSLKSCWQGGEPCLNIACSAVCVPALSVNTVCPLLSKVLL